MPTTIGPGVPAITLTPASIVRDGNSITLSGEFPDQKGRAALVKVGAHDVDMVISVGLLKSGENAAVQQEIRGVVDVAHDAGAIVKVILETAALTEEQTALGCRAGLGRRSRGSWPPAIAGRCR